MGQQGCDSPESENIVEIIEIKVADDLKKLIIKAESCGEFVGIWAYLGSAYASGDGDRDQAQDLSALIPVRDGVPSTNLDIEVTVDQLYADVDSVLKPKIIDTYIVIELEVQRCWDTQPGGYMSLDSCNANNEDSKDVQNMVYGVASFAKIYPCLAHKIITMEDQCTACSSMDDVLTLDLLIKAVALYIRFERLAEAWYAYDKATKLCQDYDDTFRTGPTACDVWGGIGCWIIDDNFIVSPTYRQPKIVT